VADNAEVRRIVRRYAESWEMLVSEAEHAAAGVLWLQTNPAPDLVMIDQDMLSAGGIALVRNMRCSEHTSHTPLLILTCRAADEITADVLRLGDVNTLAKPIKPQSLYSAIMRPISLQTAKSAPASDPTPPEAISMAQRKPLSILMADDNPVNQRVAQALLKRLGYEVDTVENGKQAVEAFSEKAYDLILMDVEMPLLNGYDATRQIRAKRSDSSTPWIIALTAHSLGSTRSQCLASGMNDFVTKPIKLQQLVAALERAPIEAHTQQTDEPLDSTEIHSVAASI
jgi:CheY-like chemotaxis protein